MAIVSDASSYTFSFLILKKLVKEKDDHVFLFISMQWGYVVITTPDGVLDHEEAMKRNVGGQVLGYFH